MLFVVSMFTIFVIFWTTGNIYSGLLLTMIWLALLLIFGDKLFAKTNIYTTIAKYIFCSLWSLFFVYIYQITNNYIYPDSINDIWVISAITWPDRYVIKINNQSWIAKSTDKYHIGDKLQILAKITNKSEYPNNIYNLTQWDDGSFLLWGKFEYNRRLAMKWYGWDIKIIWSKYISRADGYISHIYDIRDKLSNLSRELFTQKTTLWLVLGLLIGDRSIFDKNINADFINSGLIHILAVSWGNISMLMIFLWLIFFWLPYYVRIWVISILVILYGVICGADSSVVRAVIMASIATIWLFAGKEINIYKILWITYITMLIINPYALAYDLWFSLSFCAILGLLLFDFREYLTSKRLYPIRERVMPSIWANLWVLPILVLASGKINIYSIFANFVVLPVIPIILLIGVVILVFSNYLIWFWDIFIYIINNLTDWIFLVNGWVSKNGLYIYFDLLRINYIIFWFFLIWWIYIYHHNKSKEKAKILTDI